VIERMIAALGPGGWLLLEEVDFFPVQTSTSALYVEFMLALTGTVVAASGRDCLWARGLPALVAERGRVTVVDRDTFPAVGEHRRGVPQGIHTHGLLSSGRRVMDRLFAGLSDELLAAGAVPGDVLADSRWY
jgi:hypothetical protein